MSDAAKKKTKEEPEAVEPEVEPISDEEVGTTYFIPPYDGEPSHIVRGAEDAADAVSKIK